MEILKVQNLNKTYGKGDNRVEALKDVNLTVNKGEFVVIVGASGSGKSTLLHMLGGLDRPTSGKVIIDGESIYDYKEERLAIFRRRKIGFVFQFFNLIPVLDVEENIALPALMDNDKVDKTYLNEIIELLGLNERKNHLPSELSGGQQQRVSIGRALLNKPSIIFADEPTGNLDSKSSKEVIDLLKFTAKKYNQTLVLITHDIRIADSADRVISIEDGRITSDKYIKFSMEGDSRYDK
ncbi:lipoprotein-releasing system ATP-binding protein LolD [Clostridium pasteurianum DSM 525 = ATCC 6013]|uniref:Lipoprotein-releasing system ATP-binding protein LolD n=1 Tax=Clostridium pasteurianum DSM 525 = ATCC 6013 TaxID=1262449 RepID=A0A0H3J7V1_CLOPA|nr:ABC transporter ATP-binding protein [Clostridium pasteurianum]AJA49277.1 lipoprotein-releasing system ATP-binding protein LolD [Clostridium pasteurianum DSM 525 = ATCC 6013]AJA53265.1 lipoprotein-releasing system ATP-binding protein LolD [Clostridium pasteurianum DSM 525 = ATCC 6013]AOZ76455.1 peptide ABC transporter ATP-binding protein [Clostridium pasteurianum DSM 525 = ATCC 6013]AOZ80252.1 peptide ABC transporter ATP-binding protein [Clostridium pasteurianum]ELP58297.1 ABC transporter AT